MQLPPLPRLRELTDWCREVGAVERVQPWTVEKDFYLTRLIWALATAHGPGLLLKGGTCLSKIDLGYHRMSEDVDLIVPGTKSTYRGQNAGRLDPVARSLVTLGAEVGVALTDFTGSRFDKGSHAVWECRYPSQFLLSGASISVEASIQPLHRKARHAHLRQLMPDRLARGYSDARCWALDFAEVRAEKVRAAFTRSDPAIRDFYDLKLLADVGADMSSPEFVQLVDAKLAEVGEPSLHRQPRSFGLTPLKSETLVADRSLLRSMVRADEPEFDLAAVLDHYNALWNKPA